MTRDHGWKSPEVYTKAKNTEEQCWSAAMTCAGRARDGEDLRVLLTALGLEEFCRFCQRIAIIRVALNQGCACFPDDREQWLCAQHYYKVEPIGSCSVLEERGQVDDHVLLLSRR